MEIDLTDKPEEFVKLSPTGKVPMLEDDGYVLYESQIINDYLIDVHDWEDAYHDEPRVEYRQKLAMKQFDSIILEPFYTGLGDPSALEEARDDVVPELEQVDELIEMMDGDTDNMMAFHFAPFWLRMRWLEEYTDFPDWVEEFGALSNWLDETLELSPVKATAPEKESTMQTYEEHYVGE